MRSNLWRQLAADWVCYRTAEGGHSFWRPLREPGFWIMATYRLGHWAHNIRFRPFKWLVCALYHLVHLPVLAVTGAGVRPGAVIGRHAHIHTTQGVVIADHVIIGDHCTINTGACIVHRANGRGQGVARLGDHVWVGVGAKIVGNVVIGDRVVIGANAVVTHDIPSDSVAVGIPAVARPRQAAPKAERQQAVDTIDSYSF